MLSLFRSPQIGWGALTRPQWGLLSLALGCLVIMCGSLGAGALSIPWEEALGALWHGATGATSATGAVLGVQEAVIWKLRLPRIILGFLAGGALGMCGAALQGLFRNPLADPALIGVSGGGALGAVAAIVLGIPTALRAVPWLAIYAVPVMAFLGALGATLAVYRVAHWEGQVRVGTLLLAGIAMNAIAGSVIGWLSFIATDAQLRELSFWSLGSLAGGGWEAVAGCAPLVVLALIGLPRYARALNAMALGEANARYMGVDVDATKRGVVIASALAVGSVVSVTGGIGFVGLIAPHLFRLMVGADHRWTLPGAFLLGGGLLCLADIVARVAVAPAEIPVGIIVSTVGAPFFLALLLREKRKGRA